MVAEEGHTAGLAKGQANLFMVLRNKCKRTRVSCYCHLYFAPCDFGLDLCVANLVTPHGNLDFMVRVGDLCKCLLRER